MRLIDIGANLAHDSFDNDRESVILRAREAGVYRMVLTGSSEQSNHDALEIARSCPQGLYSTAGMHPHHAADYTDSVHESIRKLLDDEQVVAVGECGLDYFRDFSPRDAQREAFARQLELAVESGKPVFLHQRDAHGDFVDMLRPLLPHIARGVAHCFTGSGEELRELLDLGLYIGITGWICDERRGRHLMDIVGMIPDDRLMLETDAPYLLPRTLRPKPKTRRNEPAWLPEVLRIVAKSRGQTEEHVAETTTRTANSFFGLPD
jgi:TatD DNase family protein